MTDRKISELVAVTTVEDADEFVLARSGTSNKITGANLGASLGGSQPVTCQLLIDSGSPIDVSTVGNHALLWSGLQDDPWNENTLTEIPDGLGLSFAFDGTDNTITTTAPGTWALTLALIGGADADWIGYCDDSLWMASDFTKDAIIALFETVGVVMTLPTGAELGHRVVTKVAAAGTQTFYGSLIITRLA